MAALPHLAQLPTGKKLFILVSVCSDMTHAWNRDSRNMARPQTAPHPLRNIGPCGYTIATKRQTETQQAVSITSASISS
jgi:hypothetical protein